MAELDRRWSPYRYAYDNPLRYIDPDGMTEKERKAAIKYMRDNAGKKANDCSGYVGGAIVKAGLTDPHIGGPGAEGWNNGVANIVGNSRSSSVANIREGDAVTFKSSRSDHKGKDGKYDHIGIATKIHTDENGNVTGFDVIHKTSSKGVYEQTYSLEDGMSGFELKGVYQWDTPEGQESEPQASEDTNTTEQEDTTVYYGGEIDPVIITEEGTPYLEPKKGTVTN